MPTRISLENISANFKAFLQDNPLASAAEMRLLLTYIQALLKGEKAIFPLSKEKNIWQLYIEAVFKDDILPQTLRDNPELEGQLLQHIADVLMQSIGQVQLQSTLAHQAEEAAFIELEHLPLEIFAANYMPYFKTILRYNPQGLAIDFYTKHLEIASKKDNWQRIADLKALLLEEWKSVLLAKRLAEQLERIEQERHSFLLHLTDKIQAYEALKNALKPLTQSQELGRFWDLGQGIWQKSNTQVLSYYASQLEKNPALRKLAILLGKMRQAQEEYTLERIKSKKKNKIWQVDLRQKESYIGLTLSDDIPLAMPSELALLGDIETENLFIKAWTEKKLQTWEYSSKYLAAQDFESETLRKIPKPKDLGPIIICIDTSASMEGAPETIAKTLTFALVQRALKDKRACFLIAFSKEIKTLDLQHIEEALPALIDFLAMSFHGGTDAIPALKKAMETVYAKTYKKSDIMMISDFVMDDLPKGVLMGMQALREQFETQFYALSITNNTNLPVAGHFDAHWAYNAADKDNLLQFIHLLRKE